MTVTFDCFLGHQYVMWPANQPLEETMAARKTEYQGTYRFRLAREGVEFEVEGDRQFVLDLISKFAHGGLVDAKLKQESTARLGTPAKAAVKPSDKALSVREFIRTFDLSKHTDYVLAFGYYLEKHSGAKSFTPADINSLYYEAKLESSNTSQMLIQNIKRGFVMEEKNSDGGRKRYLLTSSGEKYIEQKRTTSLE